MTTNSMLGEMTRGRYRASELVSEHLSPATREMRLDAIIRDISDEDLNWVLGRLHYFILKIIEDSHVDPDPEEVDWDAVGLTE